jgi:hypothetical protein
MWLSVSLDVQGASALNAYCVYGHPSPFAFIGFAHALSDRTGIRQTSGVLAVFHRFSMRGHAEFDQFHFDMPRSTERDVKASAQAQLDLPRSDLSVSVAFEFDPGELPIDAVHDRLLVVLDGMRFAGGMIHSIGSSDLRLSASAEEVLKMRPGYVMRRSQVDIDPDAPFRSFIDGLSIKRSKRGWRSPSLMGFRLLNAPFARDGARGGHPHAYADPLIGAVEFVSLREASLDDLWRCERDQSRITFVTGPDRLADSLAAA